VPAGRAAGKDFGPLVGLLVAVQVGGPHLGAVQSGGAVVAERPLAPQIQAGVVGELGFFPVARINPDSC